MGQYLIDSNTISHYFSGRLHDKSMDFIASVIDQVPNISVITEIEALSWVNPDKTKEAMVREFVKDANVLTITAPIVAHCVRLRRSKRMKTPDAIIAATAISHGYTLLSSDNGFKNIFGLNILDPLTFDIAEK